MMITISTKLSLRFINLQNYPSENLDQWKMLQPKVPKEESRFTLRERDHMASDEIILFTLGDHKLVKNG